MSTHEILAAVALFTTIGATVAIIHYVRSRAGAALHRCETRGAHRNAAAEVASGDAGDVAPEVARDVSPPVVSSAPIRRLTYVAYAPGSRWEGPSSCSVLRCCRTVALDGGLPVTGVQGHRWLFDGDRDEALAVATHRALIAACEEFCLPRSCEHRPGVAEDLQLARELGLRIRFIEEE